MTPGFLTDAAGKPSHTRMLVILCVPALVLIPLVIWAILSISKGALLDVPATVPLYIGTANGIILSYAGLKSHQETQLAAVSPKTLP
jgi:hypothetical protein